MGCLLILLALSGLVARAQAPAWQQVLPMNTAEFSASESIATATDASGNVYVTGNISGSMTFGNTTITGTYLQNNGIPGFVAKWSPAVNNYLWAVRTDYYPTSIVVNGPDVYVGAPAIGTLTKIVDKGSFASIAWVLSVPGITCIAVSGTIIYVGGGFSNSTATYGNTTLTNANLPGTLVSYDAFFAKIVGAGTSASFAWVQQLASPEDDLLRKIVINGKNVYLTGSFSGTVPFGSTTLTAVGGADGFITKIMDAGSGPAFIWAQQIGGTADDSGYGLAVNGTSMYLSGFFSKKCRWAVPH